MAGSHETLLFFGEGCAEFVKTVFGFSLSEHKQDNFRVVSAEGHDAIILLNDDSFGGVLFIYAAEDSVFWNGRIFTDNINTKFQPHELTEAEYEMKRIELGITAFGKEMTDLTNPLECGLNKYVNFTKGCYIGQEVIARLDAYDKISKHMVGIISDEAIPHGEKIGDVKLITDGKECGFVTSSIAANGKYTGLGFVKTIFLDYNKEYGIKWNENIIRCKITHLPF
jgi:folate-binding protein YgfZ